MQNTRKKSSTWASFGLKHRQEAFVDDDFYPPISNPDSNYANEASNNFQVKKSYSSVAQSSMNLEPNRQGSRNKSSEIVRAQSSLEYLKKIHNWASEEIIQDILRATKNDRDECSLFLETMAPTELQKKSTSKCQGNKNNISENNLEPNTISSLECLKKSHTWASEEIIQDILRVTKNDRDECSLILETMAPTEHQKKTTSKCQGSRNKSSENYLDPNTISSFEYLKKNYNWSSDKVIQDILIATDDDKDQASNILENMDLVDPQKKSTSSYLCDKQEKKLLGKNDGDCCLKVDKRNEKHIVKNPISIEPEYKGEDDPYAIYRKNAIKISRIASRLSEKANTSFLSGDHRLAREYSSKAQEKWKIVKKLNENAAKEILSIRNVNNDLWTLDLHGLHAQEAISALKEHLWKIECQERSKQVSNRKTNIAEPQAMHQSKQNKLHVITGIGKHSQGEATLPTTINDFLIENRYRFNDSRPGSYIIHPKFRC